MNGEPVGRTEHFQHGVQMSRGEQMFHKAALVGSVAALVGMGAVGAAHLDYSADSLKKSQQDISRQTDKGPIPLRWSIPDKK